MVLAAILLFVGALVLFVFEQTDEQLVVGQTDLTVEYVGQETHVGKSA